MIISKKYLKKRLRYALNHLKRRTKIAMYKKYIFPAIQEIRTLDTWDEDKKARICLYLDEIRNEIR